MSDRVPGDTLIPVVDLVKSWSARRVADACRRGDFPNARKIGRTWMVKRREWFAGEETAHHDAPPSLRSAEAHLRELGIL